MHLSRLWMASAVALGLAGAAFAQDQSVNDYVRGLVAEFTEVGNATQVGAIKLGETAQGEEIDVVFAVDPAKTYAIYAACDDDCYDLDMIAYDEDGEEVDADYEDESDAVVVVGAGEAGGEVRVSVQMQSCSTNTCVAGVGLFEVKD